MTVGTRGALAGGSWCADSVICAVYRFREDYICDGVDVFEREARKLMDEIAVRKARIKKSKNGSNSGPSNSATSDELARGTDAMLVAMLEALELSGDMFDVFARRNVFKWPPGLKYELPGQQPGGRLYTAAEEAAADERIAQLEQAVQVVRTPLRARCPNCQSTVTTALACISRVTFVQEQRTRRILKGLLKNLDKRVPQAEEAASALEKAAQSLESASAALSRGTGGDGAGADSASEPLAGLSAHMAQVARLKALLGRLAEQSPAAALAIGKLHVDGASTASRGTGAGSG